MLFSPGRLELAPKLFEFRILLLLPLSAGISDVYQILDSFFDWGGLVLPHVWLREGPIHHPFQQESQDTGGGVLFSCPHPSCVPLGSDLALTP